MPNSFTNAQQVCTTSATTVYTCPSTNTAGTVDAAVVLMIQAANVTNRADVLTVLWTSAGNSNSIVRLCYQVPVPAQASIGCLTGKLVLLPGDTIKAQCGTHQAIELTVAALETA